MVSFFGFRDEKAPKLGEIQCGLGETPPFFNTPGELESRATTGFEANLPQIPQFWRYRGTYIFS
jgi:hypothetical protein